VSEALPLGFRYGVFFFAGGVLPNPIDIRFRKVSGLSATIQTVARKEGGQRLFTHRLPDTVEYGNLVLERGLVVRSPLSIEFEVAFTQLEFLPSNVLVTLLGEDKAPLAGWMFIKAFPVRWSISDLDAQATELVIDTMELAYTRMQPIRI
jgi:phage tail-like protein